MTNLQQLESTIHQLSEAELVEFREWFENYLEDRFELSDLAKRDIENSREQIRQEQVRLRQPEQGRMPPALQVWSHTFSK